jgi:hypothetical protein
MGTPPSAPNPARDLLTRSWAKKVAQKLQSLLAVSRELEAVEAQVDLESAKLWNLSPSDLAEIQRSLKELTD